MKVIILAGGMQSTISDDYEGIPKPMAEIGEKPILWHIMKSFSAQGFTDFIICGGYKLNLIKEYFMDYYIYQSDLTVDLETNIVQIHKKKTEPWNVTIVDTGINSTPGMRVLQTQKYIEDEDFIVAYGDCLSDINFKSLVENHKKSKKIATIAVARPTGRNEVLSICTNGLLMTNKIAQMPENQAWVNACCEVFSKEIFNFLNKNVDIGKELFDILSVNNQIVTYKHYGFWSPVETKRDYINLQGLWKQNEAPWKTWQ